MPVSGEKTFQLKEWKPDGIGENDNFQILSAENASTVGRYCYITKARADEEAELWEEEPGFYDNIIGWWQLGKVDWDDHGKESAFRADNTPVNVGDSFLIACGANRNFAAQSAGQVPTEVSSIERKGVKTPFFCNYLPVAVKLGNVTVTGVSENDNFQLLSSANASTIGRYCYVTKARADEEAELWEEEPGFYDDIIGWWELGKVNWDDHSGTSEFRANNVILGAGQGVLVAAGAARDVTISFPSSLEATK